MTPPRIRAVTLALLVAGAALLLLAGSQAWFRGSEAIEGLPTLPVRLTGRDVAPVTSAVGLLALAAAAVMLLVGGVARRVIGFVAAVGALAAVAKILDVVAVNRDEVIRHNLQTPVAGTAVVIRATTSVWPWLALVGAVLVLLGALLAAWRGGRWPARSTRYDSPVAAVADPASLPDDERSDAMWKALDRGEDPTEGDGGGEAGRVPEPGSGHGDAAHPPSQS